MDIDESSHLEDQLDNVTDDPPRSLIQLIHSGLESFIDVFSAKQILGRAAQVAVILTVVITTSILAKFSDHQPSELSSHISFTDKFHYEIPKDLPNAVLWDPEFLADDEPFSLLETHAHTTVSDGSMTPSQLVDWAIAYGFHAIFVTDHNNIDGGLQAKKFAEENDLPIVVVPGVEFTCCRIHMNLIGINETIAPSSSWPTDDEIKGVINKVHDLGGLAIVNHLPWSMRTEYGRWEPVLPKHPSRDDLFSWGVDGFESHSEGVLDLPTLRFNAENDLPLYSATDVHNTFDVPTAWTVLRIHHKELTQSSIIAKFKLAETNLFIDPVGPIRREYPKSNPGYDKISPILGLDFGYFWEESSGMYSFVDGFCHKHLFEFKTWRAVWFLIWVLTGFFIYELIRGAFIWANGFRTGRIRLA
jgi:predicted metal-dependent phosphoesterase TrpH